jgi:ribose-phosphate pyrophosphokinase
VRGDLGGHDLDALQRAPESLRWVKATPVGPAFHAFMTTLARTDPPLRRLFTGLDLAAQPRSEALRAILKSWRERTREPSPAAAAEEFAEIASTSPGGFLFASTAKQRDFQLRSANVGLTHFLGHLDGGQPLARSPKPRAAARLRRLFGAVMQSGEPLVAVFYDHRNNEFVEVLAAPIGDPMTPSGVVGGVAWRETVPYPTRPSLPAAHEPLVVAAGSDAGFGARVAQRLGLDLAQVEERQFEDGELKIRTLANVRNRDVYVISSLNGSPQASANDRLCRLLFLIGALKDAAAAHVTAVLPYLCYARKDRQTKPRDPITSRYVAQLLETMGTDRVVALEAHNLSAFQNAFRCDTDHLDADAIFAKHFKTILGEHPVTVMSPDTGGVKRAERFRLRLEQEIGRPVGSGFMEKHRSAGVVTGEVVVAEIYGRAVIIFDDLISTGGTMRRTADACHSQGAAAIYAVATHGLLYHGAGNILGEAPLDRVVLTDSVTQPPEETAKLGKRLDIVSVAGLFAEAIRRSHTGGSINELLQDGV